MTSMSDLIEELLADARKSTAKRMLADGELSFEKIAKYTNIPVKEVERLADELQKAESQN